MSLLPLVSVFVFLVIWEIASVRQLINPLFFSSPVDIAEKAWEMLLSGELLHNMKVSGIELAYGFAIAVGGGIPFGIALGWSRVFRRALDPFVSFLYSTPLIALLPLIIVTLGIGIASKVAMVVLLTFIPMAINTAAGIRQIDPHLAKVARAFGATDLQLLRSIAIPTSIPYIFTGLRLSIGRALVGVIVAEFFVSSDGMGYLLKRSGETLHMDAFFVSAILVGIAGVGLTEGLKLIEQRFARWQPATASM